VRTVSASLSSRDAVNAAAHQQLDPSEHRIYAREAPLVESACARHPGSAISLHETIFLSSNRIIWLSLSSLDQSSLDHPYMPKWLVTHSHITRLVNTGDELVLDDLAVLFPVLSVLSRTLFKVPSTPMNQDGQEKCRVKERDWGNETTRDCPHKTLDPVGSVVDLSSVLPPTRGEELVAVLGLNVGRVLDFDSGKDGESVSGFVFALFLHLEDGFLGHGRVKDVVGSEEGGQGGGGADERELVSRNGVSDHGDHWVAVTEGTGCQLGGLKAKEIRTYTPAMFQKMSMNPNFSWNMSQV
jgi:hypothetical protein